jgi:RND family efflux transporter MFP subunit
MKKLLILLALGASLMAETLTLSGTVISDNKKMITSRFMGFVTATYAAEGNYVRRGQLLYKIDSKEIDATKSQVELAISQARLSLQMYENQYTNVKLNLDRNKRLLAKDMVSKYEVENLQLAAKNLHDMVEIAQKQVEQAQERLKEVENQYKYLNIKAPNTGVIIKKNVRVGEMAMPGMPAYILTDLSHLQIMVEIAESDMHLLKRGKKVKIYIPSLKLKQIGTVKAIIPSSNPMTHTFKVKIAFKPHSRFVYPGMYATVSID